MLKIHPQLEPGYDTRPQLFDEAFFAYREDADLAWRAQRLGVRCRFVPEAIGYHRRHVLPELRRQLVGGINLLSVQNRFLLQLNNVSSILSFRVLLRGLLFRNFLVLVAVFLREWTSRPALKRIVILARRARAVHRMVHARQVSGERQIADWIDVQGRKVAAFGADSASNSVEGNRVISD